MVSIISFYEPTFPHVRVLYKQTCTYVLDGRGVHI